MPTEIKLEQRSDAWILARKKTIGSSEVSSILGTNPFKSAYTLWLEKTGRKEPDTMNAAMQRGVDYEDTARADLENKIGINFTPKVYRHDDKAFMQVSLDGISEDGKTICEIKCPSTDGLRNYALNNEVPEYYMSQIDYQLRVSGAERAIFFVWYSEDESYTVEFQRNLDREKEVEDKVTEFWEKYILLDTPPPLTSKDYVLLDDRDWELAAFEFLRLKLEMQSIEKKMELAKSKLSQIMVSKGLNAVRGGGIRALELTRKGNVNYKKIPELKNVDLEKYRGASSTFTRFDIEK